MNESTKITLCFKFKIYSITVYLYFNNIMLLMAVTINKSKQSVCREDDIQAFICQKIIFSKLTIFLHYCLLEFHPKTVNCDVQIQTVHVS